MSKEGEAIDIRDLLSQIKHGGVRAVVGDVEPNSDEDWQLRELEGRVEEAKNPGEGPSTLEQLTTLYGREFAEITLQTALGRSYNWKDPQGDAYLSGSILVACAQNARGDEALIEEKAGRLEEKIGIPKNTAIELIRDITKLLW